MPQGITGSNPVPSAFASPKFRIRGTKAGLANWRGYGVTKSALVCEGDVCRAVGLDHAQMSNVEAGKGNPTLATIEKIAQALRVTSDELLK